MRKHNGGYVLPFVLVVLVVVCLVAVSLMSSALSNLQRQQASVQRMEAKYEALGEIEKAVAGWETKVNHVYVVTFPEDATEEQKTPEYAVKTVLTEIFGEKEWTIPFPEDVTHEEKIPLEYAGVSAEVIVSVTIEQADVSLVSEAEVAVGYKVDVTGTAAYDTYTISHKEVTQDE